MESTHTNAKGHGSCCVNGTDGSDAGRPPETTHQGLRVFSKVTCFATLFLIFAGGMVTSTGSGLAVPDWPLSYGMLFPPMIGGVFYEHGHRMIAATVGFLVLVLAFWLWRSERRTWVRRLGYFALAAVICQGLLGGLTVIFLLPTAISVSHGILAQTFFLMTIVIAFSESKEYARIRSESSSRSGFWKWSLAFTVLVYLQLIIGALMRHTDSGLAVPDFPTMAGSLIPRLSDATLERINHDRFMMVLDPVTKAQVFVHLLHRFFALFLTVFFVAVAVKGLRQSSAQVRKSVVLMILFVLVQLTLGSLTVLTGKAPVITSLHVVTGAALMGLSALCTLRALPWSRRTDSPPSKTKPPSTVRFTESFAQ